MQVFDILVIVHVPCYSPSLAVYTINNAAALVHSLTAGREKWRDSRYRPGGGVCVKENNLFRGRAKFFQLARRVPRTSKARVDDVCTSCQVTYVVYIRVARG
jgi:hypothetical protein